MQEDFWNNRNNYKYFTDTLVPKELEDSLDNIITKCPIQRGQSSYARFLKCTREDLIVKETLTSPVFKNHRTGYNEIAPITAPLVYFVCAGKNQDFDNKHAFLIAGAMLGEALRHGYDFSFIGCTEEPTKKEMKTIQKCIQERFSINKISQPQLALCIGKGAEEPDTHITHTYTLHNGKSITYSKERNRDRIVPRLFT